MRHRRLIWFLLWILSLAGISHYGGAASYGLFFALTLLPLISLLYLMITYFQFKIYQELRSADIICGQPMPYSLVLRNEGFFSISGIRLKLYTDFSKVADMEEGTEYALLPGDEYRYETTLTCKYRGEYPVGVEQVIFVDFLRLFSFRYTLSKKLQATVYPRVAELTEVTGITRQQTTPLLERSSLHQEPDVIVRDYIQGDSLKRIHWKNTARIGSLQVRNDVDEAGQEITLLFDTHRFGKSMPQYLPLESRILEVVVSLSKFFVKQNAHLSVYYGEHGLQRQMAHNSQAFDNLYMQLSKVRFDATEDFTSLFRECYDKGCFLHTGIVLIILHEPEEALLKLIQQLTLSGTTVLLYAVTDKELSNDIAEETLYRSITLLPTLAEWEGLV